MDYEKKDEFVAKIKEAIEKLQRTLPKQLPEAEVNSVVELIDEFVTYTLEKKGGMSIDLADLVELAIYDSKRENVGINAQVRELINKHIDETKNIVNKSKLLSSGNRDEIGENIPYLSLFITRRFMGIANHANQYVYSSDDSYKTTKDYLVKSHAQELRDYEEKQNRRNEQKQVSD